MHRAGPRVFEHLENLPVAYETTGSKHNIMTSRKTKAGPWFGRALTGARGKGFFCLDLKGVGGKLCLSSAPPLAWSSVPLARVCLSPVPTPAKAKASCPPSSAVRTSVTSALHGILLGRWQPEAGSQPCLAEGKPHVPSCRLLKVK